MTDQTDYALLNANYNASGGAPAVVEGRGYDGQNRLMQMGEYAPVNGDLAYDAGGSQTKGLVYTTTYDAWDRPVLVRDLYYGQGPTVTAYAYDGTGRRIVDGGVHQYWNANWQLLEERASLTATVATASHLWSPIFIDALVARDVDFNGDADFLDAAERQLSQWDANFNVTSIVGVDGHVVERYRFEAYGGRTVLNVNFTVDTLAGADGTTSDDAAAGWNASDVGWRNGHQGGMYDRLVAGDIRFRHRTLAVGQMRWTTEDPLGYVDGMGLYAYERSTPMCQRDPLGLQVVAPAPALPRPVFVPPPRIPGVVSPGQPAPSSPVYAPPGGGNSSVGVSIIIGLTPGSATNPEDPNWIITYPQSMEPAGTVPAPSLPIRRPRPGSKYDISCGNTGDCTRQQYDALKATKDFACSSENRYLGPDAPCAEMAQFISDLQSCVSARQDLMKTCFDGGDTGHQTQVSNRQTQLARVAYDYWSKCSGMQGGVK